MPCLAGGFYSLAVLRLRSIYEALLLPCIIEEKMLVDVVGHRLEGQGFSDDLVGAGCGEGVDRLAGPVDSHDGGVHLEGSLGARHQPS